MEELRDFLLRDAIKETEEELPQAAARKRPNVEYSTVFVSGPDFAVRRKTKTSSSVFVCILTASQIYIKNEKTGQISDADAVSIAKFLADTEDGYVFGEECPNFIKRLERGKDFAERFMKFITDEDVFALIKKGYILADPLPDRRYYNTRGVENNGFEEAGLRCRIKQILEIAEACEAGVGIDDTRAAVSAHYGCGKCSNPTQQLIDNLLSYADDKGLWFIASLEDGRKTESMSGFQLLESRYGLDGVRKYIREILRSPAQVCPDVQNLFMVMFEVEEQAARVYYGRRADRPKAKARLFDLDRFIEYTVYESHQQGFVSAYHMSNYFANWSDDLRMQVMVYGKVVDKYPKNLLTHHQIMSAKAALIQQEIDEKHWRDAVERMAGFEYKGKRLAIVAPKTVNDIIEEAQQQSNCLASYVKSVTDGACMIFFLRKLSGPGRSFVTIEIRGDGSLGQVKARFNREPSPEAMDFVRKWYRAKVMTDPLFALHGTADAAV